MVLQSGHGIVTYRLSFSFVAWPGHLSASSRSADIATVLITSTVGSSPCKMSFSSLKRIDKSTLTPLDIV